MPSIRPTASARPWATSHRAIRRSSGRSDRVRSTGARSTRSATPSTTAAGRAAERRALWHYRLRGYRVLGTNVWIRGNELDLVLRRGRQLVFCEVKAKAGERYGDP